MTNRDKQLVNLDFSKLHRHSLGITIEDNTNNDSIIKVYPIEKLSTDGGDLIKEETIKCTRVSKEVDTSTKSDNAIYKDGKEIISIDKTKYLYATWLNRSTSNRLLPPNVCKGEKLVIYKYSNRDEYYWDTEDTDLKLRKEEHVVFSFSDKDKLDESEDEIEDRYTLTFSTRDKYISLHTTDKYGEYTTYDFKIDTKDGNIELKDGKGNSLLWDSTKDKIGLHIEGSSVKYDITVAGDDGYVEIKDSKDNSIKLDSNADSLTTNINKSINAKTVDFNIDCTNFNVNATAFNITTSSYDLKSDKTTIASDATDFTKGYVAHMGMLIDSKHMHTGNLGFNVSVPDISA